MRSILAGVIFGLGLAVSAPASATVIFNLSGVTFVGGGTLTGSFTLANANSSLSLVSSNLVASGAVIGTHTFPGYTYTYPGATLTEGNLYFQLSSGSYGLRIYLSSLTSTSATIAYANSYDTEPGAGNRAIAGGTLVLANAPEPTSIAAFGTGLLGLAAFYRGRARG